MIFCKLKPVILFGIIASWELMSLYGCSYEKKKPVGEVLQNERQISGISLVNLEGEKLNTGQFDGKTLFINFWATWCKPCLEEMPSIQKVMGILKNENIDFLFASDESAEQIENFKKQHVYDFNFVRIENLADLNIMALPTTFIFNANGKLVFNEIGYRQWDDKSNIDLIISITKEK